MLHQGRNWNWFLYRKRSLFAQPVQVDGLPHDDELVTNNINDFDLSLDEIEKLDTGIQKALLE